MASNYNLDEMTKIVGAKSLFFLSLKGTYVAMGYKNRDNENPQFSDHCFTGDYPINVEEIQNSKNELFD
jgi:amidophosphoribosyltransferase